MAVLLKALLAGCLALTGAACSEARAAARPQIAGTWRMPRGEEIKGPLMVTPPLPPAPLKPEFDGPYQEQRKRVAAADAEGRPIARDRELCIPDGVPRMLTTDTPFEILVNPGRITIIHEFMGSVRRIYMDRQHPKGDDLEEGFFGDSIGRWDGDTLVIDTVGLKSRILLFNDAPRSEQLRVVERLRLLTPDLLEDEVTIIDPGTLTKPWVVTRRFLRHPEWTVGEFVCTEDNRAYRDADGRLGWRTER